MALPTTDWSDDTLVTTDWSDDSLVTTDWRDNPDEATLDTWDDITAPIDDAWDNAADTWDALVSTISDGNPPTTDWTDEHA